MSMNMPGGRHGGPAVGLPEGVQLAPLGRRISAFLIDALVPYLFSILGVVVLAADGPGWLAGISFLLPAGWAVLQWWLCATRAATVGMRLRRLQVVGMHDGRPIGWLRALLRGLILSVVGGSLILLVVMGATLLQQIRRQGWHDLAADSVVIEERTIAPRRTGGAIGRRAAPAIAEPAADSAAPAGPTSGHSSAEPSLDPTASPVGPLPGPVPGGSPVMQPVTTGREPDLTARPAAGPATEAGSKVGSMPDRSGPPSAQPVRPPTPPPPNQGWYAVLDDDQEIPITRLILFGRNPQPRAGEEDAQLVKVVDDARTVSKTHLALAVDSRGVLVADRGSTNGSAVTEPSGVYHLLTADEPMRLPTEGYLVAFGRHYLRIVRH